MKLTNENYFSQEAEQEYLSSSQFKAFAKCLKKSIAITGDKIPSTKGIL